MDMMASKSIFKILSIALIFISYSSFGQSKTVVDQNGNGDFLTIQEAVDQAGLGDTVFVNQGIYYEHLWIVQDIVLIGEDPNNTIIDAQDTMKCISVRVMESDSKGLIKNLGIRNSGTGFSDGIGNCGVLLFGPVGTEWNVEGCNFESHPSAGLISSTTGVIINNHFIDSFRGMFMTQNSTMNILNNNFVNNGSGIFCHIQVTDVDIYNNVFVDNNVGLAIQNEIHENDYNLFWNNNLNCSQCEMGMNSIEADPLFDTTADNDYYPVIGSPLIDAGLPDLSNFYIPQTDLLGNARIIGGRIDLGSYEIEETSSVNSSQLVHFKVYPNPTSDIVFIEHESLEKVIVKDLRGKTILFTYNAQLDLKNLRSGLYILSVYSTKKGQVYNTMIVKE